MPLTSSIWAVRALSFDVAARGKREDLHELIGLQLLAVRQQLLELLDLVGVELLGIRELCQEFFGYLLLKCRHRKSSSLLRPGRFPSHTEHPAAADPSLTML